MSNAALAQAAYRYIDLGSALGPNSQANAINDAGQIVGTAGNADAGVAWRWEAGVATVLPGLGGVGAWANDINNAGEIVGGVRAMDAGGPAGPGLVTNAVVWRDGQATALTQLGAFGWAEANGINDAGVIVGQYHARRDPISYLRWHAAQWTAGGVQSMLQEPPIFNQASAATAINSQGMAVGMAGWWPGSSHDTPTAHSTMWTGTVTTLSSQTGYSATANDINDRGQVVGYSGSRWPNLGAAYLWENGEMTLLGDPLIGSQATALNEHGQIVGFTGLFNPNGSRATIWQGADALDLNTLIDPAALESGWYLSSAEDINESGWIVGIARNPNVSMTRAFLLTPVPEPSTWALLLLGAAAIGLWSRRRRD